MAKRPAFQFYPGDWRRDAALQSCSIQARGLWIEMMCLMHDGSPYGHLQVGEKAISDQRLARMVGASMDEVSVWLDELEEAEVFSRTEDGVIYCRRMVRDEDIRQKRAAAGRKGGQKTADTHFAQAKPQASAKAKSQAKSKQTVADADAVEESSNTYPKPSRAKGGNYPDDFEAAWAAYPNRPNKNKRESYRKWLATVNRGEDPAEIMAGVRRYAEKVALEKTEPRYIKLPSTFFGPDEHWRVDWKPEADPRREYDHDAATKAKEAAAAHNAQDQDRQQKDQLAQRRVANWIQEHPDRWQAIKDRLATDNEIDADDVVERVKLEAMARTEVVREMEREEAA